MKSFGTIVWVMTCFFMSGVCMTAAAQKQYAGFQLVKDMPAFKKKFTNAASQVNAVQGDFVQEKTLFALTEKITSHGKLWFKRTNKVRMDYTDPFVYSMIINGDKMLIRDGKKDNEINVRSNKLFQQINRIMVDCMQGTILESKDFTTRAFENDSSFLLELTPVSKTLKEFFEAIVVVVDKKDSAPKSIELIEPSGDNTLITLRSKQVNGTIQDAVFSF